MVLLLVARMIWTRTLARQVALRTQALAEGKATLQESEARYRSILKASPDGITVTDLKGRILLVSPEAMALFHGERESDLVGHHILEFLAPRDRDRARADAERTVQGAHLGPTRYLALRQDGSTFPMEVNSAFNREERGKPTSMILLIRDITESNRAEEALRASRELFSKAFAVCPDGFVISRLEDGVYLEVNEGFTRLTGFTPGEIIGRSSVSDAMPVWPEPKDRDGFVTALREKGEVIDLEATFLKKDRTTFTALVSAKIFETQGEKHILSITRDITEQKRAHAALRESEKRLRDILSSVNAHVFIKDANYRYTYVNPKVCELFGLPAEEILGKGDEAFFPADSVREIRESDLPVIERGEVIAREERDLSAASGQSRTYWAVKIPLRDDDGQVYGLCGISTDITPLKDAEEGRRQLQAQLHQAQKLDSLGSLAGGVAHDMNNVLGAILGLATVNLQTQPPGSPTYDAFATIAKAAARGGAMVRSLLGFARQSPAEELELDLNAILQEQARLLEHTTLSRVQLKMDLAPDLGPMRGDASALTHAFMNLCVNAVDAMPDQGTLWLRTRNVDPDWVEVSVQDTGCGMTREVLDKALDPFFTTKGHGKGTGLGLSLVYSTVKAHQGRMEIQSQPGQGTCVRMRFPICAPVLQTRETTVEFRAETRPLSLSVLIVDDDDL
ncbi:MAG TPA: PAS domain S-box protein, partial [Geothrix sp.]|nr:PAS domain S-box protein [Geothrix sp.]